MFKDNKYAKWYFDIVNRAKTRILVGYKESHHIIPKSLGGSNDSENLVDLTAKEHYICHLLLPKMTSGPNWHKMIYAYVIMSGQKKYGSKKYAFYREEYAKINSQLRSNEGNGMWGVDRSGEKNTFFGRRHSEETKQKISSKKKGVKIPMPPKTESHKKKISDARRRNSKKHTFFHNEIGIFIGSTGDLSRAYNIRASEVYKLTKGIYKSYKGWVIPH